MGKKKTKPKQRSIQVVLDFGTLEPGKESPALTAQIRVTYARPKGPKVVTSAILPPDGFIPNPNGVLEQFTALYAVDTNTKRTASGAVSCTAIVGGFHTRAPSSTMHAVGCRDLWCLEFHEVKGKPENHGWMEAVRAIVGAPWHDATKKYALIVDSDLDLHADYNARSLPIYSEFFLPNSWALVYASTDAGVSEYVANALLSRADKLADQVMTAAATTDEALHERLDSNYTRYRIWSRK